MSKLSLAAVKRRIFTMPSFPEVALLLLKLLNDPNSSGTEVANVASRDAGLAAQILRLVNSAYFSLPNKVSDLQHAISLLGYRWMKNLVVSLSLFKILHEMSSKQEDFKRFWIHSAVSAGLARRLSQKIRELEPESSYVIGLLHDIGKLALMRYLPQEYDAIITNSKRRSMSFYSSECEFLLTHHAEIGATLTEEWKLSNDVSKAILNHHDSESFHECRNAGIIYFTNYMCWLKGLTCEGDYGTPALATELMPKVGLSSESFEEVLNYAEMELEIARLILDLASEKEEA